MKKKILITIGSIILILAVGLGGLFMYNKKNQAAKDAEAAKHQKQIEQKKEKEAKAVYEKEVEEAKFVVEYLGGTVQEDKSKVKWSKKKVTIEPTDDSAEKIANFNEAVDYFYPNDTSKRFSVDEMKTDVHLTYTKLLDLNEKIKAENNQ